MSDDRYRQFVTSYKSRFGAQPYRIATLGYDAVLLTLSDRAATGSRGAISRPGGCSTAAASSASTAPFRFRSSGVGERAMEVREVGDGSVSVVDPRPRLSVRRLN